MIEIKEKEQLLKSLSKLLYITAYYEFQYLGLHEFMEKYGSYGAGIHDQAEIRFRTHDYAFKEVMKMLDAKEEYYFIPVIGDTLIMYKGEKYEIDTYLYENPTSGDAHFIIVDVQLEWILIKTNYNKVIGLGDTIKNKIKSIAAGIDMKMVMYLLDC